MSKTNETNWMTVWELRKAAKAFTKAGKSADEIAQYVESKDYTASNGKRIPLKGLLREYYKLNPQGEQETDEYGL